jgi:hypothetical protein
MSSKNDEASAMLLGIAILWAGLLYILLAVVAVVVFVALGLTVLCLVAWNKPISVGAATIEPGEARTFVLRGLAAALLLPLFVAFSSLLFGFDVAPGLWFYLFIGGYTYGSLIVDLHEEQEQAAALPPVQPQLPSPPPKALPRPPAEPFRFASWEDEEENGQ